MASTWTSNFELEKQAQGENVDTWGDPTLNTNVIARVDAALGLTTTVAVASSNVTLTQTQWRSKVIKLTGVLLNDLSVSLPLSVNSVGSVTAVGGEFIIDNQTTGAFNVTIKTAATSSVGVTAPQGYRSILYSDTLSVYFADNQSQSTIKVYAGNPNGLVAGSAGSVNTPASQVWDYTNQILYICTTAGVAASAVWSATSSTVNAPQGYLTASSNANNVILTADSIGATTLYYTPYIGNVVPIYNGTSFVPVIFAQLSVDLSASQASSAIYDVYLFLDGSTLRLGFGPSWAAGSGGSVTAGSCARGTGSGGAAIQRANGIWLNTAAMTVNNGASTYSVAALRGTCIGSIFVDATQGQVTCHRSYGQSRKFGVWNFYNRDPIMLKVGDATASWGYSSATYRAADAASANSLTVFQGLAEEMMNLDYRQNSKGDTTGVPQIAVGWNSTTTVSGFAPYNNTGNSSVLPLPAQFIQVPALGINVATAIERSQNAASVLFYGTEANMVLSATWRG